ncbi:CHAT domain-containing protein [Streptomyces sp. 3MP-14]|uniref:CHAT domain-containing protein n=1 Tax=Streptomyces mimosae TaxID=2586635 RepID=A0A5N6AAU3_9ACTN|nr:MULTISPECIES: CHAT domain-containing protein [Streptomyces]KAB8164608.1 CHAT domain-containing protein [Streptomyces mimosae]KAB8175524.1 CHAT domain-containing protein [Streptomyces sp. 3MP-14]
MNAPSPAAGYLPGLWGWEMFGRWRRRRGRPRGGGDDELPQTRLLVATMMFGGRPNERDVEELRNIALRRPVNFAGTSDPVALMGVIAALGGEPVAHFSVGAASPGPTERGGVASAEEIDAIGRAEALHERFDATHDPRHLDAAEVLFTLVLRTEPVAEVRAAALNGLGKCRWSRYEAFSERADIDEAVDRLREALAVVPAGHRMVPALRANLAGALFVRWDVATRTDDLDEGIAEIRAALDATGPADAILVSRLNSLGIALSKKGSALGDSSALDESVDTLTRALRAGRAAGEAASAAAAASNLAEALRLRHGLVDGDDPEDLVTAAELAREALAATPPSDPLWARYQSNLSVVLMSLYLLRREAADLAEGVAASRRALAATPERHPNRVERLGVHAQLTRLEFDRSAGIDHTVDVNLSLTPPPELPDHLSRASLDLLRAAVRAAEEAAAATPRGHRQHSANRLFLASVRFLRDVTTGVPGRFGDDHDETVRDLAALAVDVAAPTSQRVWAARQCAAARLMTAMTSTGEASAAAGRDALAAFGLATELLPRTATPSLPRADRQRLLARFAGLARDAAACALRVLDADPGAALRLLEHGRGVLIGQAIDARDDLTELRAAYPELADRYQQMCRALDRPEDASFLSPGGGVVGGGAGGAPLAGEDRHALAAQRDALAEAVRRLPGFAGFLRPPAPEELARAAAPHGPVALVNVSGLGSDALLVQDGRVWSVPLPDVHYAELLGTARDFAENVRRAGDTALPLAEQAAAQREVVAILGWLWEAVAEPVLTALGLTGPPPEGQPPPRMWWIPTGPLAAFPLHAAGLPDTPGASTLDRVVSSYATTVRELLWARARPVVGERSLLAVALRDAPGVPQLPRVDYELERLAERLPVAQALSGAQARHGAVLSALPDHTWAHIACHAVSPATASAGGELLLYDHERRPLSTADIARLRLERAELAYLSACDTVRGHEALADEALHIAGAFHSAGFRHVIGTLWPVDDEEAAEIADAFYAGVASGHTLGDASGAARALHEAVRARRAEHPHTPTLWAAHLHYGA